MLTFGIPAPLEIVSILTFQSGRRGLYGRKGPVIRLAKGDRVVIPFKISCGSCYMCSQGLQSQCETTQVREKNSGAALFGFSELYGSVPGGQAQYLRVPHPDYGPVKVGQERPDERYLFLSDTSCPPPGRV